MASALEADSSWPNPNANDIPPNPPRKIQNAMYQFQGGNLQGRVGPPRGGEFTFRQSPKSRISNRPLLTNRGGSSPDRYFRSQNSREKFRQVDDLTDSEEEDMNVSQSEDDDGEPAAKRLRSGPCWSNPDPYTALPPQPGSHRKKQDVIKLIRRSRVTPPVGQHESDEAANGEDFISLDFGAISQGESADERERPPSSAPRGPKSQMSECSVSLGKRKREPLDEISKVPTRAVKGGRLHQKGRVLQEWRALESASSTPWYRPPVAPDVPAGAALHQEILDYYEWVRPQEFEQEIRNDLVSRLQKTFSKIEPGCQLKPFGSFAADLYLPTGDMDLVLMTRGPAGARFSNPKSLLWYINSVLNREGIAVPGSLQPIAKAKVPIIKFVDAITGLKVDLSFNNDTGILANRTFQDWKVQYPALPILVSVIKQFLMIRGLNDVAYGGLGGFSSICLVTSLVQHHIPMGKIPNLGSLLLSFFYFYGNVFNKQDVAIRMEPPGFVRKELYQPFLYNSDKRNRLAIIDPNKADNNISGGTAEIDLVFKCFSTAYDGLVVLMEDHERTATSSKSLLVDLIGGNYDAYGLQRERLRRLYSK